MILRFFNLPLILSPVLLGACGQPASTHSTPHDDVRVFSLSERQLGDYLAWLSRAQPNIQLRLVILARATIGQTYRLGPLGEYPFELFDADPLFCLTASDCVTFVEQTLAMSLSRDWPSFFKTLQRIRYKDGRIGMLTRNHFTETDWNLNNAWLLEDITKSLPAEAAPMNVRVDRAAFFKSFGLDYSGAVQEFQDAMIRRDQLAAVVGSLRDGDIIEFVRSKGGSPFVGHLGFVLHDQGGRATILHATKPAVRELPLADYVDHHENIVGFKFLRLRPDVQVTP